MCSSMRSALEGGWPDRKRWLSSSQNLTLIITLIFTIIDKYTVKVKTKV